MHTPRGTYPGTGSPCSGVAGPARGNHDAGHDDHDAGELHGAGSSPSRMMPSRTEPTGWTVRTTDVSDAGRRGSATAISSQPSTCEVRARVSSQPCAGQLGSEVDLAEQRAGGDGHDRRDERRLEQRPGGAAQVAAGVAQDEDEAGVGDGGEHAVERAERGIVAVGALTDDAGDEHHAD